MPKQSYKKMMAEIIKKKNTITTQKDKQKIKDPNQYNDNDYVIF